MDLLVVSSMGYSRKVESSVIEIHGMTEYVVLHSPGTGGHSVKIPINNRNHFARNKTSNSHEPHMHNSWFRSVPVVQDLQIHI